MSTLQVANVHFESTGANRIEYTGNNVVRVQGKGLVIPRIDTANTPSPEPGMMFYNTSTNNMVMMSNTSAVVTIPSNTTVDAAFAKANAALANTNGVWTNGALGVGNFGSIGYYDICPTITTEGGWFSGSDRDFRVKTTGGNTYHLVVKASTGYVGIGTPTPGSLLDLGGSITTSNTVYGILSRPSGGDGNFCLTTSTGSGTAVGSEMCRLSFKYGVANTNHNTGIGFYRGGDVTGGWMSFHTDAWTERMRITTSGNIGIGTNSPGFKTEIVCGYNNGLQVKDDSSTVYGGYFTESGTMALVTRSNHGLRFGTNDTTRMNITSTGNVSIGTTSVTSAKFNLKGRQRFIAPAASNSYEENRWYSHQGHYNIASVDNNAYSNLLMFRPYQQGTTSDPPGSSLWTRVGVEVRIGGHASAIGSGDRWARYSLDYNGSGCSGVTTIQDLPVGNAPRINFSVSGWQVTLQVSGPGGAGGSLGGYCFVSLHFGGGEGSYGEGIEWSLTEYL